MNATWNLQKSIYEALVGDANVTALLGGPHVFDHVPRQVRFPYVTLGQTVARDWSTGTEDGREHILTLHVWSRSAGQKEAQAIIGAVNDVLAHSPLSIEGQHLINLRFEFADARRDPDGETMHGIVRYRAVTEPLN